MQLLSSSSDFALQPTVPRAQPTAQAAAQVAEHDAAEVVIATKLFVPNPREAPIARPRLQEQLHEVLDTLLTLVVAPAGWGKSTLIAHWLHQGNLTAGWVSLDRADDDIMRFWRYLVLAAGHAGGGVGAAALHRLDGAGADVERDVLPAFVNELAAVPGDVVVVLDDYHLVTNPVVHASIVALLEHAPPQLHLVLGTRSDRRCR